MKPLQINSVLSLVILGVTALALFGGPSRGMGAEESEGDLVKILFLHHSTGDVIWRGGVPDFFAAYNSEHGTNYRIDKLAYPKKSPYGWSNNPYDYWNIWVQHGGQDPFMEEPTLEILTRDYDVIVFKHCFPVSDVLPDTGNPEIGSKEKRAENYKLQYQALKEKMREFPETKFIVWTGAALVEDRSIKNRIRLFLGMKSPARENAQRAADFFEWVRREWDEPGDNIYIWDFQELETEEGLFLKPEYAHEPGNSHPNSDFSKRVAPLFSKRIIYVIQGRGDSSSLTGI